MKRGAKRKSAGPSLRRALEKFDLEQQVIEAASAFVEALNNVNSCTAPDRVFRVKVGALNQSRARLVSTVKALEKA